MNEKNKIESLDRYRGIPPDLWPRKVWIGEPGVPAVSAGIPMPIDRSAPPPYLYSGIYLSRAFRGRTVLIRTEPTLIIQVSRSWPYLFLNPARSIGLTFSQLLYSGTISADGETNSFGVANYMQLHFYLDVTAVSGGATVDFYHQVRDPISGNWVDAQVVFASISAIGTYYASVGTFGVSVDSRIRYDLLGAGTMTCSISYTLKEGTIGGSNGLAQTIYIGPDRDVNIESGFPILEGQQQTFIIGDNTDVWGIAEVETPLRIFQL